MRSHTLFNILGGKNSGKTTFLFLLAKRLLEQGNYKLVDLPDKSQNIFNPSQNLDGVIKDFAIILKNEQTGLLIGISSYGDSEKWVTIGYEKLLKFDVEKLDFLFLPAHLSGGSLKKVTDISVHDCSMRIDYEIQRIGEGRYTRDQVLAEKEEVLRRFWETYESYFKNVESLKMSN